MDIEIISDERLKELRTNHPVITKNYLIITPVIRAVYLIIRERVYMRSTGTFMYASPRMGKTTCVKAIKILLEAEFPHIFVMSFIAERRKKLEASMLIDILQSDKLSVPKRANYKELQTKLLIHIQSKLVMLNGHQFVLMIDEMQNLDDGELTTLATIHNRLETLDIRMTTLGFGQPEILDIRSSLMASNQSFLIARFLCEPIPFVGCASIDALVEILNAYDEELHYPEGSDLNYTRFFIPKAYEAGCRLVTYAKPIWAELTKAAKGLDANTIPMEHLTHTIEALLVMGQERDAPTFKFSTKQINAAVNASNLHNFADLLGAETSK